MTWGKVSDDLHSHPKWTGASIGAKALWVTALSYCSSYLTDGRVSTSEHLPALAVETFGLTPSSLRKASSAAAELVERGLWELAEGGYRFHDWGDCNPSAKVVNKRRKKDKRREWLHKTAEGRALKKIVRARDGDVCSWCAEPVRWGANRAPDGGTYDHVDADGPDTAENLVVSCNHCNGTKRDVDHAELGMTLRPGHALAARYSAGHDAGTPGSASARPNRDPIATESSRVSEAGSGRVGSGRVATALLDASQPARAAPLSLSEPSPPPFPDDTHYPGDHHR